MQRACPRGAALFGQIVDQKRIQLRKMLLAFRRAVRSARAPLASPLTGRRAPSYEARRAQVAELVDALVSGTSGASREGSSPFLGTIALWFFKYLLWFWTIGPTLSPTL